MEKVENEFGSKLMTTLMSNSTNEQFANITDILSVHNRSSGSWHHQGKGKWGNILNSNMSDSNISFNFTDLFNGTEWGDESSEDLMKGLNSILKGLIEKPTTHSLMWTGAAYISLITFIYYIPRMIYHRATNFTNDVKQPGYLPILYLSLIVLAASGIHILAFQNAVVSNPLVAIASNSYEDLGDIEVPFRNHLLKIAINRIVAPITAIVSFQQLSCYSGNSLEMFNKTVVQFGLCFFSSLFVFGYTYFRESEIYVEVKANKLLKYPDHYYADPLDIVPPFISAILFFIARNSVSRKSLYATEKTGPLGPTKLDRIQKVVVFQVIMAFIALVATFLRSSDDEMDSMFTFFIAGQTPVVHWVLFRSLLRSRKPNRLCFLMCCASEVKVTSTEQPGIELNQHPQTNEPSQKYEDGAEEEETQETLDANKIILMRESQYEREQEEARLKQKESRLRDGEEAKR